MRHVCHNILRGPCSTLIHARDPPVPSGVTCVTLSPSSLHETSAGFHVLRRNPPFSYKNLLCKDLSQASSSPCPFLRCFLFSKMASPTLSARSFSSSRSHSPVQSNSASTAPSTPSDSPLTFYLVTHAASASFLQSLIVHRGSHDRILHCSGTGHVKPVILQAAEILDDGFKTLVCAWERMKGSDSGDTVTYWRTRSSASDIADAPSSSSDFDDVEVHTPLVSRHPYKEDDFLTRFMSVAE